ncbi:MAG: ribosome maturation factor RimM [Gammaproteobacteria bacterium]|nr:ribosome maturation factor RimM [Gammaproteobacteria bacterium]
MQKKDNWVVLGQFGRVHGVRGMIRVHSYTAVPADIFQYPQWSLCEKNTWRPIERLAEEYNDQRMIVKIKGYETRDDAAMLTQLTIGVLQETLPVLGSDEFYCFELIGMTVVNTHQQPLGQVTQLLETGANDVLVVEGESKHLIPYIHNRVIKHISRDTREIVVEWDGDFL